MGTQEMVPVTSGLQPTAASPKLVANKYPLVFGAAEDTKSFTLTNSWKALGVLFFAIIHLPDFTSTPTATLSITNKNDDEIYSKSLLANNTKNKINVCSDGSDVPFAGGETITITLTAVPGGSGGTVYVTLYLL